MSNLLTKNSCRLKSSRKSPTPRMQTHRTYFPAQRVRGIEDHLTKTAMNSLLSGFPKHKIIHVQRSSYYIGKIQPIDIGLQQSMVLKHDTIKMTLHHHHHEINVQKNKSNTVKYSNAMRKYNRLHNYDLLLFYYLPPTKEEVYVFARVRLFVCLSVCEQNYSKTPAWIWMKCCVSTDVGI